ncbi:GNAT family N-acetyltransferase [Pedococcus ginsenosidimutans]|uniref:GNAT family N-acetyltransferase n=1 Tax=Pedococcus ginsenosidimutans TaxID=490570 RepID=A0ABP8YID2_9MICO
MTVDPRAPRGVGIRPRRPEDLPALAAVLAAQQAYTGYPQRWPLPIPVEEFLHRPAQLQAWVAEVDDEVVGHVAAATVEPGDMATVWSAGTGRPLSELAEVSVLFVDHATAGRGVGSALLTTVVEYIRGSGLTPVLDVVQETANAVRLYQRRGWQVVGESRPPWLPDDHLPVLLMVLPDDGA